MKITIDPQAEIVMRAWTLATKNEFSGLSDVERFGEELVISNPHVLDVGTGGYTEIDPAKRMLLPPSPNRRGWFHRHPINVWSGTDTRTMERTPCGTLPELIQWAVAIVWTPKGWLGRLDMFVPKPRHFDLEVVTLTSKQDILRLANEYCLEHNLPVKAVEYRLDFDRRMDRHYIPDETEPLDAQLRAMFHHPETERFRSDLHSQLEFWDTEGIQEDELSEEKVELELTFAWTCPDCNAVNTEEYDNIDEVHCESCGGYYEIAPKKEGEK